MPNGSRIDYTSKDYDGFVASMVQNIPEMLPEWTSRSPSDPGMVLVELFAYMGDILSYYGDRVANEAFLATASQRSSAFDIASMLDYRPRGHHAAEVPVTFTVVSDADPFTIPAGTRVSTPSAEAASAGRDPVEFRTNEDIEVDPSENTQYTVMATEGTKVTEYEIGVSSGSPRQRFVLPNEDIADREVSVFIDTGDSYREWSYIEYLLDASDSDEVFSLSIDSTGRLSVVFGDDTNGQIPPLGGVIFADYVETMGEQGNVGAETVTTLVDSDSRIASVVNLTEGEGGSGLESLASIKRNAPRALRAIERAVTVEDYAHFAIRSGFVGKANAEAETFSNILVYAAPRGVAPGVLTDNDKEEVYRYMEPRTLVGVDVTLLDPEYVGIDVRFAIETWPTVRHSEVERDVERAIEDFFSYQNAEFGQQLTPNELISVVADVSGVRFVDIEILSFADEYDLYTVTLEPNEIPQLNSVSMHITGGI